MSEYTYTNTADIIGEQAALDGLVSDTLQSFTDDRVISLRQYAFSYLHNIEEISLPSIQRIGSDSFRDCENLKRVILGTNNPNVVLGHSYNSFTNTPRCIIYVNDNLVSNYKSANSIWLNVSSRIYGVSDMYKYEWSGEEITDDWPTILSKINNGEAKTSYGLGDYKLLDMGSYGEQPVEIVAFDADELSSGSGYASTTWVTKHVIGRSVFYDNVDNAYDGWQPSTIRTRLINDVLPKIQTNVLNSIKEVKKYTKECPGINASLINDNVSTEKIWIPSYREIWGGTSNETSGPNYILSFGSGVINKKGLKSSPTVGENYWTRTSNMANPSTSHYVISASGSTTSSYYGDSRHFCVGFCI